MLLDNMGKKPRTFSCMIEMFYEGNGELVIFIIQHLHVLELIEKRIETVVTLEILNLIPKYKWSLNLNP